MTGGDAGGRLVRPFTLTGGRTRPSRADFTLITTVTACDPQPDRAARPQPEHLRILRLCARPVAVAEVAARLDLPVSVVVILLSDLVEADRITARPPHPVNLATPDLDLLQKVRDGLGRL
ncbi:MULTISPECIES: DUF742 domain-containing protein [Streptomyces]|uniref:DUF742 domain-containing protein n=1 Tax=Streptomyces olivaceus TaxID=47716 RepID=A0ABS7W2S4_STROV|nr:MULTISPECIES: DUF742 domain-containing protein [Streptomyces]AOW89674.1 hypothetical protein BC342_27620 [Streptomyces olivaceus]MBF8171562.1 DUF742 domain-containing protein [Streptomyces olivaceus]MBZ6084122.1 DUF742 domain-containing protein [Streptomyces olivaceus]MBZ6089672.1 DUF742 domain-containing protein [Streptomyces olivaceus]MBZ6098557.1 DUF742 domain-containing protein [Streptomyces olivaceus]